MRLFFKKNYRLLLLLFYLIFSLGINQLLANNKFALVIGNSDYTHGKLKNPKKDAIRMAEILTKLGFDVIYKLDLNKKDMKLVLKKFCSRKLKKNSTGLFYFSGHGLQYENKSYLVPIDGFDEGLDKEILEFTQLDVDYVFSKMKSSKSRLNIIILDACRDVPLALSKGYGSGLIAVNKVSSGTIVCYAASAGERADVNVKGNNSTYTKHLLEHISKRGVTIESVLKKVHHDVSTSTNGKQTPCYVSALGSDFYFNPFVQTGFKKLTITSNKYNDLVYINDQNYGATPIIKDLPKGDYTIEVKKDGYKTYKSTIKLYNDKILHAKLTKINQVIGWVFYNQRPKKDKYYYNKDAKFRTLGKNDGWLPQKGSKVQCSKNRFPLRSNYPINKKYQPVIKYINYGDRFKVMDNKCVKDKGGNDEIWLKIQKIQ